MTNEKPCQASGTLLADNIVCFPPPMVAGFVTCEGSCTGGATIAEKLAAFGSTARNNTFDAATCAGLY
jgi:hypothetical protein